MRVCVCASRSNRATTFLNSARNTCFCVVITTEAIASISYDPWNISWNTNLCTCWKTINNEKIYLKSFQFNWSKYTFNRLEPNKCEHLWRKPIFFACTIIQTKCESVTCHCIIAYKVHRIVWYRINDFFDPTHFDRTTDFPHFGLCVRCTPTNSLASCRLSFSSLCFHNFGCFACSTATISGSMLPFFPLAKFFLVPSNGCLLLHRPVWAFGHVCECCCVRVCWLSVYVYLVGLRRNLSAAYIINLNASSSFQVLYIPKQACDMHNPNQRWKSTANRLKNEWNVWVIFTTQIRSDGADDRTSAYRDFF